MDVKDGLKVSVLLLLSLLVMTLPVPLSNGETGRLTAEEFREVTENKDRDFWYILEQFDFPISEREFIWVYGYLAKGDVEEAIRIFSDPNYPGSVFGSQHLSEKKVLTAEEFREIIENAARDYQYVQEHANVPVFERGFSWIHGDLAKGDVEEAIRIYNDPHYPELMSGDPNPICRNGTLLTEDGACEPLDNRCAPGVHGNAQCAVQPKHLLTVMPEMYAFLSIFGIVAIIVAMFAFHRKRPQNL